MIVLGLMLDLATFVAGALCVASLIAAIVALGGSDPGIVLVYGLRTIGFGLGALLLGETAKGLRRDVRSRRGQ